MGRSLSPIWTKKVRAHEEIGAWSGSAVREARARPAFEALVQQHAGQTIVLVTHNVVNRVLVADFLGLPLDRAKFLHQSNCGFNEIRCRPGIIDVRSVNNDCHVWPWIRTVATGVAVCGSEK